MALDHNSHLQTNSNQENGLDQLVQKVNTPLPPSQRMVKNLDDRRFISTEKFFEKRTSLHDAITEF